MLIGGGEFRAFLLYYLAKFKPVWVFYYAIEFNFLVFCQGFSHIFLLLLLSCCHLTLCDLMDCSPAGCSVHGISRQNTGLSCHSLFQGIFPTQESNPGLPHCRQILYHLSHGGSPSIYLCWCKSNCCFAVLNLAVWYWNIFLNKYGCVMYHFNAHFSLYLFIC